MAKVKSTFSAYAGQNFPPKPKSHFQEMQPSGQPVFQHNEGGARFLKEWNDHLFTLNLLHTDPPASVS